MSILKNEDGFTLIEVLVSLTLMGMVMSLLYGALGFSAKALDRGILQSASNEDLVQSQTLLRELIEGSVPERNSFVGSPIEMRFLTKLSRNGNLPETYQIELVHDGDSLGLKWSTQDEPIEAGELTLLSNVSELHIEYGSDEIYEDHKWIQDWNREDHPSFVKIKLESSDFWPEMVVSPVITHTTECRYDPVSRECRYL